QLTVHDVDAGQAHFQAVAPAALVGGYGSFSSDSTSGAWSYTLDQAKADPLTAGQLVHDSLTVTSADGSASQTITVDITGSNDAAIGRASCREKTAVTADGGAAKNTPGETRRERPPAEHTRSTHQA